MLLPIRKNSFTFKVFKTGTGVFRSNGEKATDWSLFFRNSNGQMCGFILIGLNLHSMQQKLTKYHHVELLKEGDILYQFPLGGLPEANFDVNRHDDIKVYRITSINIRLNVIKLIIEDPLVFTWPGDAERLTMNKSQLINEGIWWV